MRHTTARVVLGTLLTVACTRSAVTRPAVATDAVTNLRTLLVAFGDSDQAIRDTLSEMMQGIRALDTAVISRQTRGDVLRAAWLQKEVELNGWPKRSVVGTKAADAAFLIVQHATHDSAFQVRMLPLLTAAATAGEAGSQDVAMLADRIAVRRGQPQMYGTQAKLVEGKLVLDPIADSANVDARRARIGLPPLAVYMKLLDSLYTPPARPH
jgi:hypothetical protein